MRSAVLHGDNRDLLPLVPDGVIDAMVTDPPAGIGWMGRDWDCFRRAHNPNDAGRPNVFGRTSRHAPHSYGESDRGNFIAFMTGVMAECWRTMKSGAHGVVWALPRTSHWTAMALEDAGFEVRDVIHSLFGSGMPKSKNLGGGVGTALKPACEHWILIRKPVTGSITATFASHGTGGLNINACRVSRASDDVPGWHKSGSYGRTEGYLGENTFKIRDMPPEEVQARCGDKGRWPPNVLLDEAWEPWLGEVARYFPKPSRSEREAGLDDLDAAILNRVNPGGLEREPRFAPVAVKNNHPTVKGIALCSWLCKLVCPPGAIILDPFTGSGSIGCSAIINGQRFLGIEQDARYCRIAEARIRHWEENHGG